MSTPSSEHTSKEQEVGVLGGWTMLLVNLALAIGALAFIVLTIRSNVFGELQSTQVAPRIIGGLLLEGLAIIMLCGHFTLQPNEARLLILFGKYKGTVRTSGFHWANPLYSHNRGKIPWQVNSAPEAKSPKSGFQNSMGMIAYRPLKTTLSLRARNFNSDKLKVNDKRGNPVEIAAVVVWRIADTAQAAFDVEDYESYVHVQSEAALRSIASLYAYDHGENDEVTLRGGGDVVALALTKELEVRLAKAGVFVEEARLTHLAYAPEIASVMLRRQQAEAIIAAREKIVLGAVSMVHMALRELDAKAVVKLDDERKAAMVSNLLVVLCGTAEAAPVINTGTLYN